MTHMQYDMTIIGGGSGGLTAARLASSLGANVLLIDKERLGGDCLQTGCVPSKSLIHVARVVHEARNAARLGLVPVNFEVDMAKINHHVQTVIGKVAEGEKVYTEDVTVRFGDVSFKSATELTLNGETFTSRNTLISTGSRPFIPSVEGLAETGYSTNENVFQLMSLPSSLLVVGGGPVGVELGQAFRRLGTEVTIVEGLDRILPKEDPEVSTVITEVLRSEGINVVTNALFISAKRGENKKIVLAKRGEQHLA
ncbi:MAG TPA: FAD-dependent oxidoreductase, partial [Ktedonobacteraceae bacterium]|nr:FAD-dependent oxidoreductase [Ktedonobacteraceae bacterium]